MSENNDRTKRNIELIRGDPKIAIRKLSYPTMLSMLLIMLYNLADSLWVAGLGANALAALGFISPIFFIIVNIGNGIGAGANSIIARAIGAKNKPLADNAAVHTILLTILLSIIVPILFVPFLKDILVLMGAGSAIQMGLDYGNIVFICSFAFIFNGVLAAILRSEGDATRSMYAVAFTAVLNIVLDPIFIYTLGMGVAGAAWASVISSLLACFVMAYWIWVNKDTYLTITKSVFKYENYILKEIGLVAVPNMSEGIIFSVMIMIINWILTLVAGTTAVAVYTSAARINQLAMIPVMGIGTAMLTVAGAAYGSKDIDKLSFAHKYAIKLAYIVSIVLCIIMFFASDYIALLFAYTDQSAMLAPLISEVLKILCFFLLAVPAGMISSMVFQGIGKGVISFIITLFRALILEIALAYFLGVTLGLGQDGVYLGMVLAAAIGTIIAYIWCRLYIRGLKKIH
jgi:putative MATE family efflux protein